MENNISPIQYVLAINTELQKKNDQNIQNFLNKYKHQEEIPELKKNTGKDYDAIISHKSTIPDLVIYNKVFNKNDCFVEANKKENNYFPRQCFFIKFEEKEKQLSKGEKHLEQRKKYEDNKKNEEPDDDYNSDENEENVQSKEKINLGPIKNDEDNKMEKEEYSNDSDDEAEEEEEDENYEEEINIQDLKNENMSKINDVSEVENNTIYSNNKSFYNEIEFLPSNHNIEKKGSIKIQDLFNQSGFNYNDNSVRYEDIYNSFSSNIFRGINNLVETNSEGNSFLQGTGNNGQKNNMDNNNNSKNFPDTENNRFQKMFLEQNQLLYEIDQKNKQNNYNNINEIKELKKNIIKIILSDPQGNPVEKYRDINEMFEYLTINFIKKDKKLDEYSIYIRGEDEGKQEDAKFFYMSIFNFLRKIKENINIK